MRCGALMIIFGGKKYFINFFSQKTCPYRVKHIENDSKDLKAILRPFYMIFHKMASDKRNFHLKNLPPLPPILLSPGFTVIFVHWEGTKKTDHL
jgi:hypothetical protein